MNKAKILASLGPASADKKIIRQMVDAGMDAARINTSHGDIAQYHSLVSNLREVKDIPIMLDTQGPEIRFRCKDPLSLSKGDQFEAGFSSLHKMYFVPGFLKKIKPGTIILFEDGLFRTKVKSISKDKVTLRALTNGRVFDKVKVNIPSLDLNLEILTKEDLAFIDFAKKEKLDFIALSFTRTAKDVMRVRKLLHGSNIGIISKIENAFGIKNFDEILDASDGIMVARGDLAREHDVAVENRAHRVGDRLG
ncbi:MAG: pyruvate kinase, partial [Nanoarchaeota archaeon]|nr:pyruvate kinase [Nanoarchaeota archaeon]